MLIYRGVNKVLDASTGGLIAPKGSRDELEIECGDINAAFGNETLAFGSSSGNARYLHSVCSDDYKTSYVSFTTKENVARSFSTSKNLEPGWVYVTDTDLLSAAGIGILDNSVGVDNEAEAEVLVNLIGHQHLPEELILKKYSIDPDN